MSYQPNPSARDPSFNETNPRREEMRTLGLRNRSWVYAVTPLAIIGIVIAFFWIAAPKGETVPSVMGLPLGEAFTILRASDVCVEWVTGVDDARPGQVIEQDPQGGSEWTNYARQVRLIVGPATDVTEAIAEVPGIACESARRDLQRRL